MRVAAALAVAVAMMLGGCVEGGGDAGSPPCPARAAEVAFDIVVPQMAGGGRLAPGDRFEVPVPLADVLPAGFRFACVRAVEAVLTWTNGPTAGADLYVGLELPATGLVAVGHDAQQAAFDGQHEETVVAALGWGPHDPARVADGIVVVVRSDWASLSSDGLPATLSVRLHR